MSEHHAAPDQDGDQEIMSRIGMVLRVGVCCSALVLLFGGVIYLRRHGLEPAPDRGHFKPPEISRPSEVIDAALEWRGRGLIQLGVMLLIATPVMRVAYSVLAFARRRDFTYVVIALVVLVVLLAGYFFGPEPRLPEGPE